MAFGRPGIPWSPSKEIDFNPFLALLVARALSHLVIPPTRLLFRVCIFSICSLSLSLSFFLEVFRAWISFPWGVPLLLMYFTPSHRMRT